MIRQKTTDQPAAATEAQYVAPQIETIEVETAQNILGGSVPGAGLPGEGVGDGGGAW